MRNTLRIEKNKKGLFRMEQPLKVYKKVCYQFIFEWNKTIY